MYGYKFSLRNGFGPVPRIPILTNESSTQVRNSARLAEVMAMLTPAEEAAIRRITPMVSIVRLTQGNLAAKGNTSCLFQKSNIGNVLPHLPQHCKYIVIQRRGPRAANDVKSTKVRKSYIHEVLVLLKGTGLEAWDVEISLDNLSQWPQDGDILDLVTDMRVIEVDEEGQREGTQKG